MIASLDTAKVVHINSSTPVHDGNRGNSEADSKIIAEAEAATLEAATLEAAVVNASAISAGLTKPIEQGVEEATAASRVDITSAGLAGPVEREDEAAVLSGIALEAEMVRDSFIKGTP